MRKDALIGAIVGDVIGSPYEAAVHRIKTTDFPILSDKSRFTDDTVLSIAVAEWLMTGEPLAPMLKRYALKYRVGYGPQFLAWAKSDSLEPYGSFGNGSAMRASACGAWAKDIYEAEELAHQSAQVTHDHPEGIRGATATAISVFMAASGGPKHYVNRWVEDDTRHGYDMDFTISEARPKYKFDPTCRGSVPHAIRCFCEADSYEEAVRLAVSLGGDSDTLACIAGGIAGAYFGVPEELRMRVMLSLPPEFVQTIHRFEKAVEERR